MTEESKPKMTFAIAQIDGLRIADVHNCEVCGKTHSKVIVSGNDEPFFMCGKITVALEE